MTTKNLDITGKVCPYCLLAVQKATAALKPADVLVISCDHPPAATTTIPKYAIDTGLAIESKKVSSGLWEIRLTKK
ncbi:MAG: sulfurtransferase TusA family protein [Methanoregula sp.]|nr:sulfurtransferase TusA family protein [Methanoregula sp.]